MNPGWIGSTLLSLFYPPHCAGCGADTEAGSHLCPECGKGARLIREPFCRQCSQPFEGALERPFTCSNCGERRFHFECAVTRYRSQGIVREFIHRFKYEGHFYLRHQLAAWMDAAFEDERIRQRPADYLVPVPLHPLRQREREFNQSEILARLLAKRRKIPVLGCLRRIRATSTQTRLDRHERMENLRGAFQVRHTSPVQSRHLILVDDVLTTGSTVEECACVLCRAGAASVRVVTVARG